MRSPVVAGDGQLIEKTNKSVKACIHINLESSSRNTGCSARMAAL
jgi:hypothetical protein